MHLFMKSIVLAFLASALGPIEVSATCSGQNSQTFCSTRSDGDIFKASCKLRKPNKKGACDPLVPGQLGGFKVCCTPYVWPDEQGNMICDVVASDCIRDRS
ncbi:hypothetical protein PGT21_010355 [Puccinia graminis f. sp. tritici]|uniref:Uncharacterized protein n=2 Tax=Puccinia graminis f. sp. tritici TaxID=56615 RepID=E3KYG7_PUCGT|nr:uncharacterized protein PGTG_15537 [Puccinia graminis f. sp. tritici CRL 75-36-700-3]EFP89358.2 hypothetical protein PGTG_15537 [Puccinia graminis f. sp. tritici CRL 75-36-700-3]KAA1103225.1 hypothetical protein PGT21_010355 [Puccinia graminis f. sp. tritici]